jgi:hypothetical protein
MRSLLIVIAAGFVVTALPASAQVHANAAPRDNATAEQAQPSGGAATAPEDSRRICVNVELSGSRMVRRVCRTAAEWEARGGLEPTN